MAAKITRIRSKPTTHKVGECPCGADIELGNRYSVSTTGPTTIKRKCQGYRCKRTNEIVLTVQATVQPATWHAHTCRCGAKIYLRRDYAGVNFEGGESRLYSSPEGRKNRTVKADCTDCHCRYVFTIRFVPSKGRTGGVTRDTKIGVYRCNMCKELPDTAAEGAS